ncbi:MAG: hypothetical protein QXU98_13190 [Candidatus Parvarchaeota archaeon]
MSISDSLKGMVRGECQVCGTPVDGRSYYCAEHKPVRSKKSDKSEPIPESISVGDIPVEPVKVPKKGPQADHYWRAFGEAIVILLNYVLLSPLDKIPNGEQYQDELRIDASEVEPIAKPLLRMFASTSVSKSYGAKVLENADIVPAIFAALSILQKFQTVQQLVKESQGETVQAAPQANLSGIGGQWIVNGVPTRS